MYAALCWGYLPLGRLDSLTRMVWRKKYSRYGKFWIRVHLLKNLVSCVPPFVLCMYLHSHLMWFLDLSLHGAGGSIHSVAEALVQWLSSLEVPVVPPQFYRKCLDCCNARRCVCWSSFLDSFSFVEPSLSPTLSAPPNSPLEDAEAVVRLFPAVHFNVFHYLVAFCKEVLAHSSDNHLTPDRLGMVFFREKASCSCSCEHM